MLWIILHILADNRSGYDIRLVFTLPPKDSTLQYKRCVHLCNNFPCIITLNVAKWDCTHKEYILIINRRIKSLKTIK